jgi:hypothetical protein
VYEPCGAGPAISTVSLKIMQTVPKLVCGSVTTENEALARSITAENETSGKLTKGNEASGKAELGVSILSPIYR